MSARCRCRASRRQGRHTIEVVSRHEQFKTELRRDVEISDTSRVTVLLIVVEVLADLLKHHSIDVLKSTLMRLRFCKAICKRLLALRNAKETDEIDTLFGSSILLMAPERQADFLWTKNSKPSLLTSVT